MDPWIPNLLALVGVAALALPAMAADRLAGRLARVDEAARHPRTDEFLKALREDIKSKMPANAWRPLHRALLYGGYGAVLLSSILRMFPQTPL